MKEPVETIRSNIRHYENLLKFDSESYTHENVQKLLDEAKAKLRRMEAEDLRIKDNRFKVSNDAESLALESFGRRGRPTAGQDLSATNAATSRL